MADAGGKSKKQGRKKVQCQSYRVAQRREFNKARRVKKVVRKHPNDLVAAATLERLTKILFTAQRKALGLSL